MTKTRNKLKILGLILALVLTVGALGIFSLMASAEAVPDLTVTIDTGASVTLKDADGDGYYDIGTADELYAFAAQANGVNGMINGELTANIVVNQNVLEEMAKDTPDTSKFRVWTPIGDIANRFLGIFDGGNHTVSGLYFNNSETDYVGLFRYVDGRYAEVQNVGVVDSYIKGKEYVGGVVGYKGEGEVTNCYNTGTVSGTSNVGGVVGYNGESEVTNCYNTGTVSGVSRVGGVVGYKSTGTVANCYNTGSVSGEMHVGGVVGYSGNWDVTRCYNTGTVSGTSNVGGVVGYSYNSRLRWCYNTGSVSGVECVGGVVSYNECYLVNHCYNTGTVSGRTRVGGVVGMNDSGTVTNCYDTAAVEGINNIGGVVGMNDSGTVTNCYYLKISLIRGGIDGEEVPGQAEGKTAEQFASGEVTCLLNGDEWLDFGQTLGTDAYPVFIKEDLSNCVYKYFECDGKTLVYTNTKIDGLDYGGIKPHHFVNGFCANVIAGKACGVYESATLVTEENYESLGLTSDYVGYYAIGNAGQLYWFAAQVDSGNDKINVILTANIVVNKNVLVDGELNPDANAVSGFRQWTPIGTYSWSPSDSIDYRYQGTFDGKGHAVSGLYYNVVPARTSVGFFSYLAEGGTVQNVGIIDSYFYGGTGIAGIVARNMGGTVKNCYNGGRINGGTNSWVGGIVGCNEAGTVINCYNVGNVSGDSGVGGVVGDLSSGTVLNCYYLASSETDSIDGTVFKTSAQFASGEVAYLLCGDQTEQAWGQDIGNDSYPVLGGDKVYCGYTTCDAAEVAPIYSNVAIAAQKPTHTMAAATCTAPSVCTACGHTEGEALGHSYDNDCDTDCNICGETRTVGEHLDSDGNSLCDACGTELPKNGLSTGAIVGIVLGAVVLLGGGGFFVFWFVIKKKRQSDLSHG